MKSPSGACTTQRIHGDRDARDVRLIACAGAISSSEESDSAGRCRRVRERVEPRTRPYPSVVRARVHTRGLWRRRHQGPRDSASQQDLAIAAFAAGGRVRRGTLAAAAVAAIGLATFAWSRGVRTPADDVAAAAQVVRVARRDIGTFVKATGIIKP